MVDSSDMAAAPTFRLTYVQRGTRVAVGWGNTLSILDIGVPQKSVPDGAAVRPIYTGAERPVVTVVGRHAMWGSRCGDSG
jgi:DNA-binding transcriptional regulator LsrR (DeoR family)